ncbi:4931_t:CDS:2, partial [Acaulospora colombiana]
SKGQFNIHTPEELQWLPHPSLPGYFASIDASLLDANVAHEFLTNSYWAAGISLDKVQLAMSNSDCIGIYHLHDEQNGKPKQIGYARWITDRTTFAYLADVFIHKDHAGQGLGSNEAKTQPWNPKKMLLLRTSTAQTLYERYGGFKVILPDDKDGPIVLRVSK